MAKKRKAAARKRATRKSAARRRRGNNPDATINALVILVVIVMVLGGLYLYVQNKKQAALLPTLGHAVASLVAPVLAPLSAMIVPTRPGQWRQQSLNKATHANPARLRARHDQLRETIGIVRATARALLCVFKIR
jgi:hypothetical protein